MRKLGRLPQVADMFALGWFGLIMIGSYAYFGWPCLLIWLGVASLTVAWALV